MEPRVFTRGNSSKDTYEQICAKLLQWSHASSRVETALKRRKGHREAPASMEPRVFTRGNIDHQTSSAFSHELLQWSHASSRVETTRPYDRRHSCEDRFNGATRLHAWKLD